MGRIKTVFTTGPRNYTIVRTVIFSKAITQIKQHLFTFFPIIFLFFLCESASIANPFIVKRNGIFFGFLSVLKLYCLIWALIRYNTTLAKLDFFGKSIFGWRLWMGRLKVFQIYIFLPIIIHINLSTVFLMLNIFVQNMLYHALQPPSTIMF